MRKEQNQWSNALGITIVSGINSYYSNEPQITYYGGTISELSTVWDGDVSSTSTGHTHYSYYYDGPLCYNGYNYYSGEVMVNAIGYIVDMGNSLPQTKKTCTHELGHALGWMGHSSNDSDIMYLANSYVTSLTSRDINHLSQVY